MNIIDCPYYDDKECGKDCIVQDQIRNMGYLCLYVVIDKESE